jgi:hypothetical protein
MTKRFVCPALLLLSALAAGDGTGSGVTLQIAAETAALAYDKTSLEAAAAM